MNKFEKVSYEQFSKDYESVRGTDINFTWGMTKSIYEGIKLPQRATKLSAGYDIYSPVSFVLKAGDSIKIPTGIRVILDDDKYLAIYPRSGLGFKYKLNLWNCVGILDADYASSDNEGHIWIKMFNGSPDGKTLQINVGDAFCQGIIQSYYLVDGDSREQGADRNGGFGSTG